MEGGAISKIPRRGQHRIAEQSLLPGPWLVSSQST